jgi:hypothetical protein
MMDPIQMDNRIVESWQRKFYASPTGDNTLFWAFAAGFHEGAMVANSERDDRECAEVGDIGEGAP